MHSSLIVFTILVAVVWRWRWQRPDGPWQTRWESALSAFCLPPLMVVLAAGAVLAMGHHGTMLGWSVSPVGCWISLGVTALVGGVFASALGQAVRTQWRLRQYPVVPLPEGGRAQCLPIDLPMAAQVGLWRSALLVSRGWLEQLPPAEQQAMLAHEQAHADHHDPFWFFWLGVVRRFTSWLPNTASLWEELLLLREMRADHQAANTSDPLLLAELLVKLARQMALDSIPPTLEAEIASCVGFNDALSLTRLEQRVNALVEPDTRADPSTPHHGRLAWLFVAALPLVAPWLHT
ncbi:M56 family metallopeptidase [Leptolyngbya sp. CCNP1308]|uniref:M56 family metallopeptidase n=1 Tax=Leptolyngbya sp. CCNP1308 TaxID=3110255 RepID=UPI002B215B7C|nr:M56 family metallopeptidase [Leptolyngbya sp. CCNP1308]MEA5448922.1 M56 family metallopeptidase [Leptolyngbya sp. CCNP1308]